MRNSLCILSVALCSRAFSFSVDSVGLKGSTSEDGIGRRHFLSGVLVATSSAFVASRPCFADVSDGNTLPTGAAQFSRVLNIKSDLTAVGKRVAEHANEIDDKEWNNIGDFLRKLYNAGEDMIAVAAGIADPEKKEKAEETAKLVQKYAKAGDLSVSKQDSRGLLSICKQEIQLVDEFFGLLQDVPDEI